MLELLQNPTHLIQLVGLLGLICIVFAETGLLIGFFLPGDSLLIAAGLFAAKGDLNIVTLIISLIIAAIVGDTVGFHIGKYLGQKLYSKEDSFFFRRKHILSAQAFYEKHGGKTIIIARFVPIIRTFAPTIAGAANMPYGRFVTYNITGAVLWVMSMCLGGYYLGQLFGDKINDYLHLIIILVIILSFAPIIVQYIQSKRVKPNV